MISSVLALALATTTAQASDTTRAAREAFAACLRSYVDRSLEGGTTVGAFAAEYPQQCATQESALREAVIRREVSGRVSRADAEEAASMEVEDSRLNFSEYFEMSTPTTETATAPTEASTAPTETATAPTEAATAPTEASTAPTEAATAPTEASTAPTETAATPPETATPAPE